MPTRKEILEIDGRQVTISNPDKVYFPVTGYTKMDLVSYYLAVADGALRGAGGRPMALKRFVDGAAVEARAPSIATSKWWKEERHGVFLDYNQNAKDRTVASAYSVRPLPDARVSMPLRWDEVADVEAEAFTLATVPGIYAAHGDAGGGINEAVGSLEALLE